MKPPIPARIRADALDHNLTTAQIARPGEGLSLRAYQLRLIFALHQRRRFTEAEWNEAMKRLRRLQPGRLARVERN
jgi:hypothetical protein